MEYKQFLSRISAIEKECLDDVVTILKQTGDVEFNDCDCPEVSYYDSYGKIETVGVKSISVVGNGIELELFNGKILDGFGLADNSICEVYLCISNSKITKFHLFSSWGTDKMSVPFLLCQFRSEMNECFRNTTKYFKLKYFLRKCPPY